MRLIVYDVRECDPKKCTAKRLQRAGKIELVNSEREIPPKVILLDPFAEKAISKADAEIAENHGIAALDCSWKRIRDFSSLRRKTNARALPYLVAANPTNFGKPTILSTAEALAAALSIIGHRNLAEELMKSFKWGQTFLDLNREPLQAYAAAKDSNEVVELQKQFMPG